MGRRIGPPWSSRSWSRRSSPSSPASRRSRRTFAVDARASRRSAQFDLTNVFTTLGVLTAILVIFAIMLTDFFDTMGTVTGVAAEAGLANEDGSVPGVGRVLLVDSVAAAVGGLAGVSSNTTYIESAAGVAEGARTGLRVGRHRRPVPARDLPRAARRDHPGAGDGAGPRRSSAT